MGHNRPSWVQIPSPANSHTEFDHPKAVEAFLTRRLLESSNVEVCTAGLIDLIYRKMFPKQHAAVSGLSVAIYAVLEGLALIDIVLWTFLGAVSGVLIDVDHAVLSMVVKKRYRKGLNWFKNPVGAVTRPSEFLDDMDYEGLIYHRIFSHVLILGLLINFSEFCELFIPVGLGVGVHLVSDIFYDLYTES